MGVNLVANAKILKSSHVMRNPCISPYKIITHFFCPLIQESYFAVLFECAVCFFLFECDITFYNYKITTIYLYYVHTWK